MNKTKSYKGGDKNQAFQGDIGIFRIEAPEGLKFSPLKEERLIVGHSESGHHHVIVKEREADVEFGKDDTGYFLRINSGKATIVHEKVGGHEPQTLIPGVYFFSQKWEYDEVADRKVRD